MCGMKKSICISLLTDFGLQDSYVGSMKGVILGICPTAQVVDVTHMIAPQCIHSAAFTIEACYRDFPKGTVHVVVVDPGVGSDRDIIAVKTRDYYFLAPDNGVLTYVLNNTPQKVIRRVTNQQYFNKNVSCTFHGRDIFAPVAARLSQKAIFSKLGSEISKVVLLEIPKVVNKGNVYHGEIIAIDAFGNLISNIKKAYLKKYEQYCLTINNQSMIVSSVYADTPKNELLALIGSSGYIEVACCDSSAESFLGAGIGTKLTLRGREIEYGTPI